MSPLHLSFPQERFHPAAPPIGTFYVNGNFLGGAPHAGGDDLALVIWHFEIDGVGAFDTTGIVKSVPVGGTYPQIVTGASGGLAPAKGKATVTALDPTGFQFRIKVPISHE